MSSPPSPSPGPADRPHLGLTAARSTPAAPAAAAAPEQSFFDAVGGHATFEALVDRFYEGVATDPVLRPMYPEAELDGARWRLTRFLEQYWGGPTTYSDQRGHPRLRMRHAGFRIGPAARDAWLAHMRDAVEGLQLAPAQHELLWDYLQRAAHSLLNTFDDEPDA